MELLENFRNHFDVFLLVSLLVRTVSVLLCIVVHELSHGLAARLLGDPTAKRAGRLSLNPLRHIDPLGFLMMLVVGVGWAKPVPVDLRRFKRPKLDMAITALAGPISNFLLAAAALALAQVSLLPELGWQGVFRGCLVTALCFVAVLSVGLGMFNLIPIPPLDGSRVLLAVLPDRLYWGYIRYEQYLIFLVVALAWFGAFSGPLSLCMSWSLRGLCALTGFPFAVLQYYFGVL